MGGCDYSYWLNSLIASQLGLSPLSSVESTHDKCSYETYIIVLQISPAFFRGANRYDVCLATVTHDQTQ